MPQMVKVGPITRRTVPIAALVVALAAIVALPAGAAARTRRASRRSVVALPGLVVPGLRSLTDLGAAPGGTKVDLAVAVSGRSPAGEAAAYRSIYTPDSARYHRYLTPTQIADQFGAPASRWAATRKWLESAGLHVTYASPLRDLFGVTGTVRQVQSRFGVRLRTFRSGTTKFLANTSAPRVPARLGISSVLGLNTLQKSITTHQRSQRSALASRAASMVGQGPAANLLDANLNGQTPQDLWGAYQAPAANIGAGQTVAVFGAGATDQVIKDLHQFETESHLPTQTPVTVHRIGSGSFGDTSGLAEWNIDTQAAAGMAPGLARIDLYFAPDLSDAHVAQLFDAWAADAAAPRQANASFGECEQSLPGNVIDGLLGKILNDPSVASLGAGTGLINELQPVADASLRKATLQGKTLFSASGDTGSSCPVVYVPVVGAGNGVANQAVPFTSYPASSPYVTAVGGTVLYTTTTTPPQRALEYGWTFGGGGDSLFIDQPAYQAGVPGVNLPCLATVDGKLTNLGKPCRGIPDVAALSGDALTNYYPIVSDGADSAGGGTSLSSPLWVGMWARAQAASTNPGGLGFANETIYRLGKAHQQRDFFDVTTGLLGVPAVGNGLYTTGAGWDYVTGWGPPNLSRFIADAIAS